MAQYFETTSPVVDLQQSGGITTASSIGGIADRSVSLSRGAALSLFRFLAHPRTYIGVALIRTDPAWRRCASRQRLESDAVSGLPPPHPSYFLPGCGWATAAAKLWVDLFDPGHFLRWEAVDPSGTRAKLSSIPGACDHRTDPGRVRAGRGTGLPLHMDHHCTGHVRVWPERSTATSNERAPRCGPRGFCGQVSCRPLIMSMPSRQLAFDGLCHITISCLYRDKHVFDTLGERVVPELGKASCLQDRAVRCWCGGCACGEEVYTLKLLWELDVRPRRPRGRLEIIGSDADLIVLQRAERGCFSSSSLKGMPAHWRELAFTRDDDCYCIRAEYRDGLAFLLQNIRS